MLEMLQNSSLVASSLALGLLARTRKRWLQTLASERLETKLTALQKAGKKHLRVVVDFDYTLTTFFVEKDGKKERGFSCHRMIEECGLLSDNYHDEAKRLQDKYFPLEISTVLSKEEKHQYMVEWVTKAHEALVKSGLREEHIAIAVKKANVKLRDGVHEFLDMLEQSNIPLLIFSAGIAQVLEEALRQKNELRKNIIVVSNRMVFDKQGVLAGFEAEMAGEEPYHVLNKRYSGMSKRAREELWHKWGDDQGEAAVLLVGDSVGDVHMSDGLLSKEFEHGTRELRIGLLNHNVEGRRNEYEENFDLLILNDGDFTVVNEVLGKAIS